MVTSLKMSQLSAICSRLSVPEACYPRQREQAEYGATMQGRGKNTESRGSPQCAFWPWDLRQASQQGVNAALHILTKKPTKYR